ncbi:MAG: CZB domain-containing protein [Gammaproteobacteria bacterium]|nr:CZB domain-containing protein [Gammaproteobacteria bacterium]
MVRTEAIEMLRIARTAHMQWMARAKAIVAGVALNKDLVPVMHTDCKFGQWYYGPGQLLNTLKSFQDVERTHAELHQVYSEIFNLIFGSQESSLLKKLFSVDDAHKQEKLLMAKQLIPRLVDISKEMLILLDHLENDLTQMQGNVID